MLITRSTRRRTPTIAALAAIVLAPCAARAQEPAAEGKVVPRPRTPYVVAACPGECCHYGTWRFDTLIEVHALPRSSASVMARIAPGHRVRADSGHVRIDTIGLALVRRDFRDPDTNQSYHGGDTLLLLDYLGEGFSNVWVRGERRQLSLFDMRERGAPVPSPDTATLVELRPATAEWWAHVTLTPRPATPRTASGAKRARQGWVNVTRDVGVSGAHACGSE